MRGELKTGLIIAGLSTLTMLVILALSLVQTGEGSLFARLDAPVQDAMIRIRNASFEQPISPDITLIGIDDRTTKRLGRFGQGIWRTRQPFIDHLWYYREYQPSVVAYDLLFKEDEGDQDLAAIQPETLAAIQQALAAKAAGQPLQDKRVLLDMADVVTYLGNENLAGAFNELAWAENAPTLIFAYSEAESRAGEWTTEDILGTDGTSDEDGRVMPFLRDVRIPLKLTERLPADFPFSPRQANLPTDQLFDAGLLGFIHVPRDDDGVVRRYPLVWGIQYSYTDPATGEQVDRRFLVPSMALLATLVHLGIDLPELNWDDTYTIDGRQVIEIRFGDQLIIRPPDRPEISIPIDDYGYMLVDFVGRIHDYRNLPFSDISANPRAVEPLIRDQIVFIGTIETGGADIGPTVVGAYTPWVLVHMSVANNILTDTFIRPTTRQLKIGIMLALWLLLTPLAVFLRPRPFVIAAVLVLIAYFVITFASMVVHAYVLPLTPPAIYITFGALGTVLLHYLTEEKEKQRIRGMFSTMVSDDVLHFMEEHPESFSLAGQRREATMFFSDVAGFTSISESLPADRLVELLNQYLSPMTEIILDSQGFVDKYEGDAIMAEWGVPYPNPDHAKLGCWAALDQQQRLAELRPQLKQEFDKDIYVRMGLNSGAVSAGNMGSAKRFSYTVMGDAVNQAARFEPANKDYDTEIMIGETTYQAAKDHIEARLLDKIVVKGKTVPIRIYELIAKRGEASDDMLEVVRLYEEALHIHWERRWDEALAKLDQALEIRPEDGPSKALRKRILAYQEAPPPEEWLGEYIRASKD